MRGERCALGSGGVMCALAMKVGRNAYHVHPRKYAQGSGHRQKPEMEAGRQEESRLIDSRLIDSRLERQQRSLMGVARIRRRTPRTNCERLESSWGVLSCLVWPFSSKMMGVSGVAYVPSLE
jgi:hypothetical protein